MGLRNQEFSFGHNRVEMMIRHQSADIRIYIYIYMHVQKAHTYTVKDDDVTDAIGNTKKIRMCGRLTVTREGFDTHSHDNL